jgi:hypothetical protein
MMALLFLQGWRVSEVLGLAWADVDLEAGNCGGEAVLADRVEQCPGLVGLEGHAGWIGNAHGFHGAHRVADSAPIFTASSTICARVCRWCRTVRGASVRPRADCHSVTTR